MIKAVIRSKKLISRMDGSKAYPLNESDLPVNPSVPADLIKIVDYLDVENSPRYKQKVINGKIVSTYCNIYAYDYAYIAGAYLPRLWWYEKAAKDIEAGLNIEAKYAVTVAEVNANSLYFWFDRWATYFGWIKVLTASDAQALANKGYVVIITAAQKISNRSGHITVVVPELNNNTHKVVNGEYIPLQSQSGALNKKYSVSNWYKHDRYIGYAMYAFKPDSIK